MKEQKSQVNARFTIENSISVVSVLNSGSTRFDFGHSVIVVEMFDEKGDFRVGQYDLCAKDISGEMIVSEIRCFESHGYQNSKPYSIYPNSSWCADPENVCNMIKSIKEDQEKTEKAKKGQGQYIKYSFVGENHFCIKFFQENNMNCADWCLEKLKIAVPNIEYRGTAKPKLLAGVMTGREQEVIGEVQEVIGDVKDWVIEEVQETFPRPKCVLF